MEKCKEVGETQSGWSGSGAEGRLITIRPHVDCCMLTSSDEPQGEHWPAWIHLSPMGLVYSEWWTSTMHRQEQADGCTWGPPKQNYCWSAARGWYYSLDTKECNCNWWNGNCPGNGQATMGQLRHVLNWLTTSQLHWTASAENMMRSIEYLTVMIFPLHWKKGHKERRQGRKPATAYLITDNTQIGKVSAKQFLSSTAT